MRKMAILVGFSSLLALSGPLEAVWMPENPILAFERADHKDDNNEDDDNSDRRSLKKPPNPQEEKEQRELEAERKRVFDLYQRYEKELEKSEPNSKPKL